MQEIYHYSIIEIFSRIGKELGFFPIKEYALLNSSNETSDERVDLVWINFREMRVEYAFEFETSYTRKAISKWLNLSDNIKKYIFFVNKSFNFESVDAIFIKDSDGMMFLYNIKKYGIKLTMHGKEIEDKTFTELENLVNNYRREETRKKIEEIANGIAK
jgi:hypothetical protein